MLLEMNIMYVTLNKSLLQYCLSYKTYIFFGVPKFEAIKGKTKLMAFSNIKKQ